MGLCLTWFDWATVIKMIFRFQKMFVILSCFKGQSFLSRIKVLRFNAKGRYISIEIDHRKASR